MRFLKLVMLLIGISCWAQDNYLINAKYTIEKFDIDGRLEESIWSSVAPVSDFFINKPIDTSFAENNTEVRMAYNDNFLVIHASCYDKNPGKYIVQSLKRDFSFPRTDAFAVFLDTYSDGNTGFSFGCNPYGSQREGTLAYGGRYGVSTSWDHKWYSATTRSDSLWTLEMAIPFSTIRFKEGVSEWKINFSRNDQKQNEESSWVPVPINFNVANLAFTGTVKFDKPLSKKGVNASIVPYIAARATEDYQFTENSEQSLQTGGLIKYGITSSLNLDVTINPDFSNAEVDDQVTDLSRFELNFPEKRQFFLENSDLFGNYGYNNTNPFYSRRIGLGYDTVRKAFVPQRILFGTRLSGKIDENWRLGVLSVQTGENEKRGIFGQNYSMLTIQRKLFKRSDFGVFMVNRQGWGTDSTKTSGFNPNDYNRVVGGDFNFRSSDGLLVGKTYYHHSFSPEVKNKNQSFGTDIRYDSKKLITELRQEYVGENFRADVGYVPRRGYWRFIPSLYYLMYPKKKSIINWHMPYFRGSNYLNTDFKTIDNNFDLGYRVRLINTAQFELFYRRNFIELQRDFDPSRSGGDPLLSGSDYDFSTANFKLNTDERKNIFFDANGSWGEYYTGNRLYLSSEMRYRVSPWGNLSIRYSYNNIDLPGPQSSAVYHLLGPKLEVTFTDKIYLTTYLQLNTQTDNVNVNSRFQWRFAPASDFFIVYTENYLPENLTAKNRSIVLKINYWFNL